MKQHLNKGITRLLVGAALWLTAVTAFAQSGESVTVQSVDNYAGNSNVQTDRPNTTVTITELDADKKPVRSWTGTTDSSGKITIPAGSNLSVPYLRAKVVDPKMAEFVVPSEIVQNEPFLFTAGGVVEGAVVDIRTVEGEVVATKKADKYGRVFLAAGLVAGTYLVSAGNGRSNKIGSLKVGNEVFDPSSCAEEGLALGPGSAAIDISKFGALEGNFPNPGSVVFDDFESRRTPQIRAASTSQVVFDRPADLGVKPGEQTLTVRDTQTGQSAPVEVVFYSAQAKLTQVKVQSGSETHLIVAIAPKELAGNVNATILGGPVSFADGGNSMALPVSNGQADFPMQSAPGSTGKFNVSWLFTPEELVSKVWDPIKKVWEPVKKKLKSHLWEPLKKKLKSYPWTPPKTDPVKGNDPKANPPAAGGGDPKANPPAVKGGDTKAMPPEWEPFSEEDEFGKVRKGKRIVVFDGGKRTETKTYDDGAREIKKTEVKTDPKTKTETKTETTDSTVPTPPNGRETGTRTETTETVTSSKDGDKWVEKSRKRTVKDFKDNKQVGERNEKYVKGRGWVPDK